MLALSASQTGNRLLAALSRADLDLLQPHLKHGPLKLSQDLERPTAASTPSTFRMAASHAL
jgi:hypothetical protein